MTVPMVVIDVKNERERQQPRALVDEQRKEESTNQGVQGTRNMSQSSNEHVIDIYKYHDLYLETRNGSRDAFSRVLDRVSAIEQASFGDILRRLSPAGNTFLHIAAKHGNEDIVTFIAEEDPSLLSYNNSNGEIPLHLAAKGGYESTVKALVEIHKNKNIVILNVASDNNIFRAKNEKGNTALHEALINGRESIAQYLIQEEPEVLYYQNKRGESALYLAAKAGFVGFAECISSILRSSTDQECINEQFKNNSPTQAAILGKNIDVLKAMLNVNPSLIQLRDGKGMTPLHCAASLGYLEEVEYLLEKYAASATQRDESGLLPIHMAAINGRVAVIKILLNNCPFPDELLDGDGSNILHLAAKNGRYKVVRYILNNPDLSDLINMKDKHGNVPLHLATMHWYPEIVSLLTWDKRVDVKLVNNEGMTALDFVEHHPIYSRELQKRLTKFALMAAGVPQSSSVKTAGRQTSKLHYNKEALENSVNTLLLVFTLVATVTFAASFTMPGGYNSSGTDLGIATMLREPGFHIFVYCDSIAMYSSIVAIATLVLVQKVGNPRLMLNARTFGHALLWLAFFMMSITFTAGVFLTVSKLRWLCTAVLLMGITFCTILIAILITSILPLGSSNMILRYISYYPFYFMILTSSGELKNLSEQENTAT